MPSSDTKPLVRSVSGLSNTVVIGLIVGGLLPLGASLWWPFELLSHFRLQYLALAVLALVLVCATRRPRLALALMFTMIVNALPLLPYTGFASVGASELSDSAGFSVLNINVNASNPEHDRILDALRASRADVIMLIELSHELEMRLESLDDVYPYQALFPEHGNFGIGLLSTRPFNQVTEFELGPTTAIEAAIELDGKRLGLLAVHTWPPMNAGMAATRSAQLDALAQRAARTEGPLVICGDLNLSPYSPYFRRLLEQSGAADTRAGRWPGISWPTSMPLLGIPIDHCLTRGNLAAIGIKRLNSVGSDHYPVQVNLNWQSQP